MALFKSTLLVKINPTFFVRFASKCCPAESSIKKTVFISQSKDVYTNLALQDWICNNTDLSQQHVLMLWQNDPCVTIGQSQNPWYETNFEKLPTITDLGVKLARQNTNGPSMYHDNGNLNITFFTQKDRFDENYNMKIISRALFREYSLKMDVNEDFFTMRGNYNISGSTRKLGHSNAYHHCNLLVKVNKFDLAQSLMKQEIGIQQGNDKRFSNSKIMNLSDENSNVTVQKLIKTIGWEYMRTQAITVRDGGNELASQQNGFQLINPTEDWFPGLSKIRDDLTKWEWIYGETPDFKLSRVFRVPDTFCNLEEYTGDLTMGITVSCGLIKDITVSIPSTGANSGFSQEVKAITTRLIGQKFSPMLLDNLQESIKHLAEDKDKFVPPRLMSVSF